MPENDKHDKIAVPKEDKGDDLSRSILKGLAATVGPLGSISAELFDRFYPSNTEQNVNEWQHHVTEVTNQNTDSISKHEKTLYPTTAIKGITARVAVFLANKCTDGLNTYIFTKDVIEHFGDINPLEVEDAIYELQALGLVQMQVVIGKSEKFRLTDSFYTAIDEHVMGWNTKEDEITIMELMLEANSGWADELINKLQWTKRRFNPAFRNVTELFPSGRVSQTITPDYPTMGVSIMPEDRAMLKRTIGTKKNNE